MFYTFRFFPLYLVPSLSTVMSDSLAPVEAIAPVELQLSLQYEPVLSGKVKQSSLVTLARQRKVSVDAKRILGRVFEQIVEDALQLREVYQFRFASLLVESGLEPDQAYHKAVPALRELATTAWEFMQPETRKYLALPLLSGVGYLDGIVSISLNPRLATYFLNIAGQYSQYKLDLYLGLSSWYAMRLYEILSTYQDTGWWEIDIETYRLLMDCGPELDKRGKPKLKQGQPIMKMPDTFDLIKNTVLHAQKELAATPFAFDYSPLYAPRAGRGRPKIVGLRFELHQRVLTVIPDEWLRDRTMAPVIGYLREFKVHDKNIATYLRALTVPGALHLVREWRQKEVGPRKIDDRVRYCNAAFVRAGKQAIEQQRKEALEVKEYVQQVLFPGS